MYPNILWTKRILIYDCQTENSNQNSEEVHGNWQTGGLLSEARVKHLMRPTLSNNLKKNNIVSNKNLKK